MYFRIQTSIVSKNYIISFDKFSSGCCKQYNLFFIKRN
ncbi:hypothetical protein A1OE_638 [Candidatus Endolissoclinum faulkneri L2]|uniref:Uncharacterized protein n=1 Tax=Candidatus Endolissoclinum faulkneri L2 TaxID=1193729 RepID=K7ZCR2_9PROT|nr:hypothetical protein A1OE_638 [Candidatus Endolissoclinum faulkneri L2]